MNGYQITFFTQQDKRHHGKPLAVLGYGLGALSKPLLAIAGGAGLLWDRFGAEFTFVAGGVFAAAALLVIILRKTQQLP